MKATRIFLFLSPLMLLCPPLVPIDSGNVAWTMLGGFYGLVLRRFPWNFLMGGLCYMYAQQLGREAARWALVSFVIPFGTPLVLAFMPPKFRSTAYNVQEALAVPAAAKGVVGTFQDRFPLLNRCLAGKPEATHIEQGQRFQAVAANFEFAAIVDPGSLDRILPEAAARQFTVWTEAGADGTHLYGASLVQVKDVESVTAWLKTAGRPGEKLDVAWRHPDGSLKFFEYYPV